VRAKFLLGPAGSGKTFRCLAEIRAALKKNADGNPLIFLAPKQATFQIERQLLDSERWGERPREPETNSVDGSPRQINGFTRLQIFSFDRLAQSVFEKLNVAPPKLLSAEGRVMVLRALLLRHEKELKLFSRSARRPGFAQELSALLAELQQHQFTFQKLRALAAQKNLRAELRDKLSDLALLFENYSSWLAKNDLHDSNQLLAFAADALRKNFRFPLSAFRFSGLWLDGFAEMTPQELDLLATLLPFCEEATLAFCLDESDAHEKENSWLSIWNVVGKSFQQCRQRVKNLPDCKIEIKILPRDSDKNRFAKNPELAWLEANWSKPTPNPKPKTQNPVRAVSCANADAEAIFAAREILKFARQKNSQNRFRDCAILVRNLDAYHQPLAREFRRYQIPFFLDRREAVAHHPLAELTRSALRTVIFDWRQDDLFAALKSGFCDCVETEIDRLENAALEFGWRGKKWRAPLQIPQNPELAASLEKLRRKILPPFESFFAQLAKLKFQPAGNELAEIFRRLWSELKVEQQFQNWSDETNSTIQRFNDSTHSSVFDQMNSWLDNLVLAFPREKLPLRDWLPILESGLANLTVGVVPPVLDEVLIGAIDRARNPDLKFALVLGVNETIFPAAPKSPVILTSADRDELEDQKIALGPNLHEQISREQFLGYIACTRASEKLVVTFSRQNADGEILNPSPFIAHLQKIFPALEIEEFQNEIKLSDAEHTSELSSLFVGDEVTSLKLKENQGLLASSPAILELLKIPALAELKKSLEELHEPDPEENLSPPMAEKLYGPILRTSVSRLEEFAACPFRFFVRSGLRAEERKVFELDARERGSFQHDVLKEFHLQATKNGARWRDLTPARARAQIEKIAGELIENFRGGLLRETAQSLFAARAMTESLQNFIEVTVGWLREQNEFDPSHAELDFGIENAPALEIDLAGGKKLALKGRIDRVDLWHDEKTGEALALILDYKAGGKKLDALFVENGIQLQLLAYLSVLRRWKNPREIFGAGKIIPAGVFYVNLRGQFDSGSRAEVLAGAEASRRAAYKHTGRFDASALEKLDRQRARDQFNYRMTDAGKLYANSVEALPRVDFEKLLDRVENQLRDFGNAIFSGVANVSPYKKGKQVPCEFCDYRAACRIDPWTHSYRVLRAGKIEDTV
jgi:ATP-dependent helicase/nuclease subunit B